MSQVKELPFLLRLVMLFISEREEAKIVIPKYRYKTLKTMKLVIRYSGSLDILHLWLREQRRI